MTYYVSSGTLNPTHSLTQWTTTAGQNTHYTPAQLPTLSKSCYSDFRKLRCIRPYRNLKTASIIDPAIVYCKLDFCKSLCYTIYQNRK